jgi:uncharacterized protein (DUF1800 family)
MKRLILLSSSLLTLCLAQAQVNDHFGAGQVNGVVVTSSSQSNGSSAVATINGQGMQEHLFDASRFLSQSTLGANHELISEVAAIGPEAWIDLQYAMPTMSYRDTTQMIWDYFVDLYIDQWGESEIIGNGTIFPVSVYWRQAWWNNTMKGEDQLRQRIALALSEILVVSEKSQLDLVAMGLADYYDVLYKNAFGNYRDILEEVTFHPAMGFYLSHLNNEKTDAVNNIHPDENYAREVMQLFTIGLYELNQDGSIQVDADNEPIPTYDNDDIQEYAKVFTGLGPAEYWSHWEDLSSISVFWDSPYNTVPSINMYMPMVMFQQWHEPGEKYLLNGQVVPAGQTGNEDIQDVIDNLFNHPNVGPFIGKQLIQRLVKSNPSPEYVERVAQAFNDNGDGVRGDMKAVIKAILLDDEARDCSWIDLPSSGKMREPIVRYTQFMRAFDANNQTNRPWNSAYYFEQIVNQHVLASPSVFNFFLPSYSPHGEIFDQGLVAPEFQLLTSATSVNYVNLVFAWLLGGFYMEVSTIPSLDVPGYPEGDIANVPIEDFVLIDITDELALVNQPEVLTERLNLIFLGGTMSDETKATIAETISTLAFFDEEAAVKSGIFLTLISPDYVIQK